MNILFLLTPKKNVLFLNVNMRIEDALALLKDVRYSSVPLLDESGYYVGTITEGDLLWHLQNSEDHKKALKVKLGEIHRYRDYKVAGIDTHLDELFVVAISQNYIPIIDDRQFFIGIITRREIISYYNTLLKEYKGIKYNSDNPALDVLYRRRSIRKFSQEKIDEAIIDDIIKAGLLAPSARHKRPINILFSDDQVKFRNLFAKSASFKLLNEAPYALFIFGDMTLEDNEFLLNNNASATTMNLLNAITSFNLGGVWLGAAKQASNAELVSTLFNVPAKQKLYAIIAFGVADEVKEVRDDIDFSLVHKNKW